MILRYIKKKKDLNYGHQDSEKAMFLQHSPKKGIKSVLYFWADSFYGTVY